MARFTIHLKGLCWLLLLTLCPLLLVSCAPDTAATLGVEPYAKYLQHPKDAALQALKLVPGENATVIQDDASLLLQLPKPVAYMGQDFQVLLQFTGPAPDTITNNSVFFNRFEQFTYFLDFEGKDLDAVTAATGGVFDKMRLAYKPYTGEFAAHVVTNRGASSFGEAAPEPLNEAAVRSLLQTFERSEDDAISIIVDWTLPGLMEFTDLPPEITSDLGGKPTYGVTATLTYLDGRYVLSVNHLVNRPLEEAAD